jgi:hypothetical protein
LCFAGLILAALAGAGCESRNKAKANARMAFMAGEQAALTRMAAPRAPSVMFVGPVRNPLVGWVEGLTLARAIVAAGYQGKHDPRQILIVRNGQAIAVEPKQLLEGEDIPLLKDDMIQLQE